MNGPLSTMLMDTKRIIVHELGHALKGYKDFGTQGWSRKNDIISNWVNPTMKELGFTLMRDPMAYQCDVYLNQNIQAKPSAIREY